MYIFTQPRAAKQTGPTERKSGGYVIAPKSHLTAKKRHLSLSLIVLQVLQITHTRFFWRSVEAPECTFSLNPAPPSRLGRLTAWQDRQEDIDPEFARLYGPYLLTLG